MNKKWGNIPEKEKYLIESVDILKRSQKERKGKYTIEILGKKFFVYPNVFSPVYFSDTEFFAQNIPIDKDDEFLEVGSGTGVVSVFAALKGASKVVAIDINLIATENTIANSKLHEVANIVKVLCGDVYDSLNNGVTFHKIFWNVPFGCVEVDLSILERSIFDKDYSDLKRYIFGAKKHLKDNGKLYIGFSTTIGQYERLEKIVKEAGFKISLLKEKIHQGRNYPVKFEVFEAC